MTILGVLIFMFNECRFIVLKTMNAGFLKGWSWFHLHMVLTQSCFKWHGLSGALFLPSPPTPHPHPLSGYGGPTLRVTTTSYKELNQSLKFQISKPKTLVCKVNFQNWPIMLNHKQGYLLCLAQVKCRWGWFWAKANHWQIEACHSEDNLQISNDFSIMSEVSLDEEDMLAAKGMQPVAPKDTKILTAGMQLEFFFVLFCLPTVQTAPNNTRNLTFFICKLYANIWVEDP